MSSIKCRTDLRFVVVLFFALFVCLYSSFSFSNEENSIAVKESYQFYGLASYLNEVKTYSIDRNGDLEVIQVLEKDENTPAWLAWVGRFNVLLYKTNDEEDQQLVTKDKLRSIDSELDLLRYSHLWYPLAMLTKWVEWVLTAIFSVALSWGWTIIIYAIFVKILLFPIGRMTVRFQKEVGLINKQLLPTLSDIKSSYDGEEAHKKIMTAHKELGVGPFYSLKPLMVTLIQLPLLIATFNALAEMPQLDGSSFLWITNLAYPDTILSLPLTVPLLGNGLNLLPLLMTLVSVSAAYSYTNDYDSRKIIKKQKRNLYLMAFCFLILFYPFPAAMVFYWMTANFLHLLQQKLIA